MWIVKTSCIITLSAAIMILACKQLTARQWIRPYSLPRVSLFSHEKSWFRYEKLLCKRSLVILTHGLMHERLPYRPLTYWEERRSPMRIVWIVVGIFLILIGIVGWVLPLMPGWPFFLWGVSLLAREIPWVGRRYGRLRSWCIRRFPRSYKLLIRWYVTLAVWLARGAGKVQRVLYRFFP